MGKASVSLSQLVLPHSAIYLPVKDDREKVRIYNNKNNFGT